MDFAQSFAAVGLIMLLACMSPGPDFVAVTSRALADRRDGVLTALGVAAGCVVWAGLAVFGLGLVIARLEWLYWLVRLGGAAYLTLLGARMLLSVRRGVPQMPDMTQRPVPDRACAAPFCTGFLVNMTNPKAVAFFGSLFVTVLPADAPLWVQLATVGVVGAVSGVWFTALALAFSAGSVRAAYLRLRRPADAFLGAALMGLGAKLALSR